MLTKVLFFGEFSLKTVDTADLQFELSMFCFCEIAQNYLQFQ